MRRTLICLLVCASAACASTVNGSAGFGFNTAAWNNGHVGKLDNDGGPFFDYRSVDGLACNVGYYISGQSANCTNQPGNVDRFTSPNYLGPGGTQIGAGTDFWVSNSSTQVSDLQINFNSDAQFFVVQLMAEASLNHTINEFGFYTTGSGQMTKYLLFRGTDAPLTVAEFSPGTQAFGFYLNNGTETFYSESIRNHLNSGGAGDTTTQHFAVFRDPQDANNGIRNSRSWDRLWIGVEESRGSIADRDFNDMILAIRCYNCGSAPLPVGVLAPEPDAFLTALGGVALIVVALVRRRRRPRHGFPRYTIGATGDDPQDTPTRNNSSFPYDPGDGLAAGSQTAAPVRQPLCQ